MIIHQIRRLPCKTHKSVKVNNVLGNFRSWHRADFLTELKVCCDQISDINNLRDIAPLKCIHSGVKICYNTSINYLFSVKFRKQIFMNRKKESNALLLYF